MSVCNRGSQPQSSVCRQVPVNAHIYHLLSVHRSTASVADCAVIWLHLPWSREPSYLSPSAVWSQLSVSYSKSSPLIRCQRWHQGKSHLLNRQRQPNWTSSSAGSTYSSSTNMTVWLKETAAKSVSSSMLTGLQAVSASVAPKVCLWTRVATMSCSSANCKKWVLG